MKNEIKAFLNTLVQDIIKPCTLYVLVFVVAFGIFFGSVLGIIRVLDFFFPHNGETVLYLIISVLMLIFLIILFICWIIEYFQNTVIPNYKNKLKQLDNKDKKY